MITIYKNETDIPAGMDMIKWNDLFFNRTTADHIDDRAGEIIKTIDNADIDGKYKIRSSFNGTLLDIDKLSSGCKTLLNILYFPDRVFSIKECGENALDILYSFSEGRVFSDYPMISFSMNKVQVVDDKGTHIVETYNELKDWWNDEK